jgi:glycosyltransferase involved in cell wall biosynthesis
MSTVNACKPNIIQIISYYPPHLGGMENCAAQIAEGLVDKGYPVEVYTSDAGCSQIALPASKAHVHYLKCVEFAHTPVIFTLFFKLLSIPRFSVMHLHVSQAYSPEIVYLISKLKKIPFIAHIHLDVDASGPFGFLLKPYKKVFLKRVLQSASKIICLSEPQKKLIADKYALPLHAITVIPNGVGEIYFTHKTVQENTVPHLLFVGRLAPQKNLPLLLEAIAQMKEKVHLDIVGEGEDRSNIEALIIKQRLQNVILHGKKTGQELIDLYKSADIFVLPSFKEGISLSMLEALAAGLPVVASDSPEIREILAGCGLLIKDPTAANYAKALDAIVSNKSSVQKLSALSVQKARSYSWLKVLDSIEGVYQEVKHDIR